MSSASPEPQTSEEPQALVRAVQVAPEHYDFESYDDLERWSSYWHQIRAALRLRPRSVLEIGSGSGVFRSYLRGIGVDVKSVDIDDTRKPDLIADVSRLDETLPPGMRFDVIAAFQVLEHLPFTEFERCLEGIRRRTDQYALISLPCNGFQLRFSFGISTWRVSRGFYVRLPWKIKYCDEHYWELGPGHSIRKVTRIMERYFEVIERYYVKENPYHYCWVLRPRNA